MRRDRWVRLRELVRKEFLQIRRDPRLMRIILIAPIFQLIVFGYAVSTDVRRTALFVVDLDNTQSSRALTEAFTSSEYFRVAGASSRPEDLVSALDHADAIAGLEIPRGFADDLASGTAQVQLLFDGSNSNMATIARGYAERIVGQFVRRQSPETAPPAIDLRTRAWFNPDLESRDYNVPGVVALIILLVGMLLTSLAVVREREIGTLEQLMVSPLTSMELIIGKTIPFAIIGLIDLGLVSTVAVLWFGIPFNGNPVLLVVGCMVYLLPTLGMGLLISTVSTTQQEAFMLSFLVLMPVILLSGFMFPVSSMPEIFQQMTLLNPVRHFLEIIRGIFLKGAGISVLWPQLLWLAGMGIAAMALAASRFRKTAR
ncbi:MAG TPA: ABC transporter permease [bacterium]|nr:ABC transporter permease [bacterium]